MRIVRHIFQTLCKYFPFSSGFWCQQPETKQLYFPWSLEKICLEKHRVSPALKTSRILKLAHIKIRITKLNKLQNLFFPRFLIINHGETCNDLRDEACFYFRFVIAGRQMFCSYFWPCRVENSYFFFHRLGLFRGRVKTEGWWGGWLNLFRHLVIFPDIRLSSWWRSGSFPVTS